MSTTPQYEPKHYTAGKDVVSAKDLNARGDELKRLGKISVHGGNVQSNATGVHIAIPPGLSLVNARITGVGTGANDNAHSWVEIEQIADGDWQDKSGGLTGDATASPLKEPAYEINGSVADVGTRVQLWRGLSFSSSSQVVQQWFFTLGGSSGNPSFLAKITGGSNPYAWSEVDCGPDGTFPVSTHSGARSGTTTANPAWEYNRNEAVAANTIVRMWPCFTDSGGSGGWSGADTEYAFHHAGSGGSDVKLIKVTSATQDGAGYHPGVLVGYSASTNTYSTSGTILVRNATHLNDSNDPLSVRAYLGIKIGAESGTDVYHVVKGAECIDGTFTS